MLASTLHDLRLDIESEHDGSTLDTDQFTLQPRPERVLINRTQ